MIYNKLTIYTGPMFAAKTSKMLLHVEKMKHAGYEIHVFKPFIDNRYSSNEIVTHMGWSLEANVVSTGADIEEHMLKNAKDLTKCLVVVDELFMIPGVSDSLLWFYKQGVDIVVSSLDLSSSCKPFEEVHKLLPWATEIVKCSSACSVCGQDALYTYKTSADDNEIAVGGKEMYQPRCLKHHPIMIGSVLCM